MAPDPLNDPLRALMPDLDKRWERYDRQKLWLMVSFLAIAVLGPILLLFLLTL